MVTVMLLKVVVVVPLIDCVEDPFNTNVPDPALNVPLLVKFLATLRLEGEVNVPETVTPPKLVALLPAIKEVPLNTTVPPLLVNVPLFVHVPATFMVVLGAVRELAGLITKLLKELMLEPDITVVPPKVTVPDPELSVPLLTKLPLIFKLDVGVNDPVIVTFPKTGVALPVTDVAPENVIALDVKVDELLLTKFPFKSIALLPALKLPDVSVNVPFTVTAEFKLIGPLQLIVRFPKAEVFSGNSNPVVSADTLELV